MESSLLGIVLDSSVLMAAERRKLTPDQAIESVHETVGEVPIVLCSLTIAEIGFIQGRAAKGKLFKHLCGKNQGSVTRNHGVRLESLCLFLNSLTLFRLGRIRFNQLCWNPTGLPVGVLVGQGCNFVKLATGIVFYPDWYASL